MRARASTFNIISAALSSEYQTKIPMAGYAMGTFVWCGRWDFPAG